MATVPLWLLGKHLTSVIITPQVVSSAGVFSDGTPVTLTTYMTGIGLQLNPQVEEINALNTVRENEVILSDGASLELEIIRVNNTGDPAPLRTLVLASDFFKVVYIEGTAGSQRTVTFYGHRGAYSDGFRGRGQSIANLQLGPIDIGAAQVAVAS